MRQLNMQPANSKPLEPFFCKDKAFYSSFWYMFLIIALQNIVTYSVNVADNIMLGAYNQTALAGVAAINQLQFVLQQFTLSGLGEGLVIIAGQYWGAKNKKAVEQIIGAALIIGVTAGAALTALAFIFPQQLTALFTDVPRVAQQAQDYLAIIRLTYIPFIISNLLLVSLRSMQIVKIAFKVSCTALVINIGINYVLIFGHFGAPEMGVKGAAIGTLIARCVELCIVIIYCYKKALPIRFRLKALFPKSKALLVDYLRVSTPCVCSALLFGCAVAVQTMIFGHISEDAMAAASASGALFQYCKMIPVSAAAAASTIIAKAVGGGERATLNSYVRTLQVVFIAIGFCTCGAILLIRTPALALYSITPTAYEYAMQMLLIQAAISIGMAYQMPCQLGIIRAGGDTRYTMISDFIYSWGLAVPLGLLAAFVWRLPFAAVAICLNCDQVLKCVTVAYKTNTYTWIKKLTK